MYYTAVSYTHLDVYKRQVLICDPEAEFGPVVDAVRGQNIRLAPDSTQHVNALELGKGYDCLLYTSRCV